MPAALPLRLMPLAVTVMLLAAPLDAKLAPDAEQETLPVSAASTPVSVQPVIVAEADPLYVLLAAVTEAVTVAAVTVNVALPAAPGTVWVEVTVLVVSVWLPTELPAIWIVTLQEAPALSVAALKLIVVPVDAAVPPHVFIRLAGVAKTRPDGSVFEKPIPVSDVALLEFVRVKVSVAGVPSTMLAELNEMEIDGAAR